MQFKAPSSNVMAAGFPSSAQPVSFDLKPKDLSLTNFDYVMASLSCGRESDAENSSRLIFSSLSSDAEWLSGEAR